MMVPMAVLLATSELSSALEAGAADPFLIAVDVRDPLGRQLAELRHGRREVADLVLQAGPGRSAMMVWCQPGGEALATIKSADPELVVGVSLPLPPDHAHCLLVLESGLRSSATVSINRLLKRADV